MKRLAAIVAGSLFLAAVAHAAPLSFRWDRGDATDIQDGYIIYRKDGQAGDYAEIGRTGKLVTTFVDETVAPGQVQCWTVKAYQGVFQSPPSNEVCSVVLKAPITLRIEATN